MTFDQAFADARAKGEKQFNYKGKPYAVQLATPAAPAPAKPAQVSMAAPPVYPTNAGSSVNPRPTGNPLAQQVWDSKYASGWTANGTSKTNYKAETTTYNEDQLLARIVQLSRGR
jgi:hypothetical protein